MHSACTIRRPAVRLATQASTGSALASPGIPHPPRLRRCRPRAMARALKASAIALRQSAAPTLAFNASRRPGVFSLSACQELLTVGWAPLTYAPDGRGTNRVLLHPLRPRRRRSAQRAALMHTATASSAHAARSLALRASRSAAPCLPSAAQVPRYAAWEVHGSAQMLSGTPRVRPLRPLHQPSPIMVIALRTVPIRCSQ